MPERIAGYAVKAHLSHGMFTNERLYTFVCDTVIYRGYTDAEYCRNEDGGELAADAYAGLVLVEVLAENETHARVALPDGQVVLVKKAMLKRRVERYEERWEDVGE